jgi:hypothetical protein
MPIALYLDENVDGAIAAELRKRGVDVITTQEDGSGGLRDDRLLARASQLSRVLFTYDIRFKAMGEDWIRQGKPFAGLIWAHPLRISIGQIISDLELAAKATDPQDWANFVDRLPL